MICFYLIMFLENTAFLAAYYWCSHHTPGIPVTWFSLGAMVIVLGGTAIGLISLALYYRLVLTPASNTNRDSKDREHKKGIDYLPQPLMSNPFIFTI